MPEPTRDSLLVAVTQFMREGVLNRGITQRNGGNATWWPRVALAMQVVASIRRAPKTWRELYRAMPDRLKQQPADLQGHQEALEHILTHERLPNGTATTDPEEPQWAPPLHRSEDPNDRIRERKNEILREHDRKVAQHLVDQAALTEMLVEAVERGAQLAPPVVWRPAPQILVKPDAVEEIPVALLGDIHVGTLVDAEEMGGLGEYNFDILKRRLNNYQTRIAQTIDLHRKEAKIRRMVVYILGDVVEGEVIFDGQAFRIELITVDQLFEGTTYIMGWLLGLLATGLIEEIHVICIYGNHGRTTHKKGASKAHSNWDYVAYRHMQAVLANEPRIKWFIPKAWFAIVDVMGWRVYGTHGDVIKAWMGIPFYGIQRHDMRTTTLLQTVNLDYRYWVCGDKHVSATIPRVTGAQIMNGSTVGGSDFSMHQLGTASEPMQTMFGINERLGKTWQYDYILDKRDPEDIRKHLAYVKL